MTMPHVNSGGSEDFFSNDEVKVYKDEGEEEKRSSEGLSEDKIGLVTETEEGKGNNIGGSYSGNEKNSGRGSEDGKSGSQGPDRNSGPYGSYVNIPPYSPYPNGSSPLGKSMVQPPIGGLMYSNEYQPPPAHMGIPPVVLDPKTGLPRHPMYAYPAPGQFPPSLYGPDFPPVQWSRTPAGYPISSGAFSGPFPPSLVNSHLSRFGPPGLFPHQGIPHPGMSHPAIVSPGPKQECGMSQHGPDRGGHEGSSNSQSQPEPERKKPHIKKPLNAFMLFMKEKRQQVVSECTLKESAAINQILGRKWHMLDRDEQSKYYDMARKEKERHRQLYPGWSARDNYANQSKKKRKKKENKAEDCKDSPSAKKCRAVFGLDKQDNWCKPCQSLCEQYCNKFTGLKVEESEWHALDRAEQSKYYDMARKEKELHMQLYPSWSARDNYATHTKKKRKKKDSISDCSNPKKCRARYGVDQQSQWCKPCRRKKKCIRCFDDNEDEYSTDGGDSENLSDSVMSESHSHSFMRGKDGHFNSLRKQAKYSHIHEGRDYLSDGSDSIGTTGDSDSLVGSPLHSINSKDKFSTPSKSFCRNSPSPLDVGQSEFDLTIQPCEESRCPSGVGCNGHCSADLERDLDSTLTSTPTKLEHSTVTSMSIKLEPGLIPDT